MQRNGIMICGAHFWKEPSGSDWWEAVLILSYWGCPCLLWKVCTSSQKNMSCSALQCECCWKHTAAPAINPSMWRKQCNDEKSSLPNLLLRTLIIILIASSSKTRRWKDHHQSWWTRYPNWGTITRGFTTFGTRAASRLEERRETTSWDITRIGNIPLNRPVEQRLEDGGQRRATVSAMHLASGIINHGSSLSERRAPWKAALRNGMWNPVNDEEVTIQLISFTRRVFWESVDPLMCRDASHALTNIRICKKLLYLQLCFRMVKVGMRLQRSGFSHSSSGDSGICLFQSTSQKVKKGIVT